MLAPKAGKTRRKTHKGRLRGKAYRGSKCRRSANTDLQTVEPGMDHESADRVRACRHYASHQAWREGLDSHLPRQTDYPEACGDPHGEG